MPNKQAKAKVTAKKMKQCTQKLAQGRLKMMVKRVVVIVNSSANVQRNEINNNSRDVEEKKREGEKYMGFLCGMEKGVSGNTQKPIK